MKLRLWKKTIQIHPIQLDVKNKKKNDTMENSIDIESVQSVYNHAVHDFFTKYQINEKAYASHCIEDIREDEGDVSYCPQQFFLHHYQQMDFLEHYVEKICYRIMDHIKESSTSFKYAAPKSYQCFCDYYFGLNFTPTFPDILNVFKFCLLRGCCEVICIPISLIYIERMMTNTNNEFRICASNWKSTICCCMCLASKVYKDSPLESREFAQRCECGFEKFDNMERTTLDILKFRLVVSQEELHSLLLFAKDEKCREIFEHPSGESKSIYQRVVDDAFSAVNCSL